MSEHAYNAPVSPAISTFSLPMALPLVVNGRLEGIWMLGMTSCGKLSDAPFAVFVSPPSSSPLDVTAWLPDSSMADSSSESFSECSDMALGVLGTPDVILGEGVSVLSGVRGVELAWLESFLLDFSDAGNLKRSAGFAEPVDEPCDADLDASLPACFALLWLPTRSFLRVSGPNAASSVSARLFTPNVLSRDFAAVCVFEQEASDCSISSSLLMKKAVGTWLDATAAWSTLDLRDRGLTAGGRASPPGNGRMLAAVAFSKILNTGEGGEEPETGDVQ